MTQLAKVVESRYQLAMAVVLGRDIDSVRTHVQPAVRRLPHERMTDQGAQSANGALARQRVLHPLECKVCATREMRL